MRIHSDEKGKMNCDLREVEGRALVVSQFTLHAATKKGNRPSFIRAAAPEMAEELYEAFCKELGQVIDRPVQQGIFGADMKVSLINDGPVTIFIDSQARE